MGNFIEYSQAYKDEEFEIQQKVEKEKPKEKEELDVELVMEELSLDVISYSIFPFLWFQNNLFKPKRIIDYFGRYKCDPYRRIYQVSFPLFFPFTYINSHFNIHIKLYFCFYVKICDDFLIFPPRNTIGMKFWHIYDRVPLEFLKKMKRVEFLHYDQSSSDLILNKEIVEAVSSSIRSLKFRTTNLDVLQSFSKCKLLREIDCEFRVKREGIKQMDIVLPQSLRNIVFIGHSEIPLPPISNLINLRELDLFGLSVIDHVDLEKISKKFRILRKVKLRCTKISPLCNIFSFFGISSVEIIEIRGSTFSPDFSKSFQIPENSKLMEIRLSNNYVSKGGARFIDRSFMEEILQKCKSLRIFEFDLENSLTWDKIAIEKCVDILVKLRDENEVKLLIDICKCSKSVHRVCKMLGMEEKEIVKGNENKYGFLIIGD